MNSRPFSKVVFEYQLTLSPLHPLTHKTQTLGALAGVTATTMAAVSSRDQNRLEEQLFCSA